MIIDTRTGRWLGQTVVSGLPLGVAVDSQAGRIFVPATGTSGSLNVLDARTGHIMRVIPLSSDISGATITVDVESGRAFLASADATGARATVRVFDTRSALLLRTLTLKGTIIALAAWTDRGRAVVVGASPSSTGVVSVLDATR